MLSQGGSEAVLGKEIDVSGYVLDEGDDDVFFVGSDCWSAAARSTLNRSGSPSIDPAGVKSWRSSSWVAVRGTFIENPDPDSPQPAAVKVNALNKVAEPDQPYAF